MHDSDKLVFKYHNECGNANCFLKFSGDFEQDDLLLPQEYISRELRLDYKTALWYHNTHINGQRIVGAQSAGTIEI